MLDEFGVCMFLLRVLDFLLDGWLGKQDAIVYSLAWSVRSFVVLLVTDGVGDGGGLLMDWKRCGKKCQIWEVGWGSGLGDIYIGGRSE